MTLEDGVLDGGFGEKIARFYGPSDVKVINFGLKRNSLTDINLPMSSKKTASHPNRLQKMQSL